MADTNGRYQTVSRKQLIELSKIPPVRRSNPYAIVCIPVSYTHLDVYKRQGQGEILTPAVQRVQPEILPEDKPPGFVKGGLHGKLVMLNDKAYSL